MKGQEIAIMVLPPSNPIIAFKCLPKKLRGFLGESWAMERFWLISPISDIRSQSSRLYLLTQMQCLMLSIPSLFGSQYCTYLKRDNWSGAWSEFAFHV